jgi:hypothetical protein
MFPSSRDLRRSEHGASEAHGGRIQLANREGGGFSVALEMPLDGTPPAGPLS